MVSSEYTRLRALLLLHGCTVHWNYPDELEIRRAGRGIAVQRRVRYGSKCDDTELLVDVCRRLGVLGEAP